MFLQGFVSVNLLFQKAYLKIPDSTNPIAIRALLLMVVSGQSIHFGNTEICIERGLVVTQRFSGEHKRHIVIAKAYVSAPALLSGNLL